uniref:Uncharacterized protein n=1 Tax=Cyprinodon variegatus TaxID=28743 RepID=A0A3Q2GNK9_CYPVA
SNPISNTCFIHLCIEFLFPKHKAVKMQISKYIFFSYCGYDPKSVGSQSIREQQDVVTHMSLFLYSCIHADMF